MFWMDGLMVMEIMKENGLFVMHNQGCASVNLTLDRKLILTICLQANLIVSHIYLCFRTTH